MSYILPKLQYDRHTIMVEVGIRVAASARQARLNGWTVNRNDMNRYLRFHARQVWGEAKHERGVIIARAVTRTPEEAVEVQALLDITRYHDPIRDRTVVHAADLRLAAIRAAGRERAIATLKGE